MSVVLKIGLRLLLAAAVILLGGCLACGDDVPGFGIYLVDNGELVLSEDHIEAYDADSHTIELNEAGLEKWSSYVVTTPSPKLKDTLNSREFAVKVKGETMYQGTFGSMISSRIYEGIVIMEPTFNFGFDGNTIRIEYNYPGPAVNPEDDPRNHPELLDFFEEKGLLR